MARHLLLESCSLWKQGTVVRIFTDRELEARGIWAAFPKEGSSKCGPGRVCSSAA